MYGCDEFSALLDLFLDGELAPEEMVRVQEHLDACPDCQHYIEEMLEIRAAFPDVDDTPVPEHFTEDVMARIQAGTPKPIAFPRRWRNAAAALAACCAVVVLLRFGPMGMTAGRNANVAMTADTAVQQRESVAEDSTEKQEDAMDDAGSDCGAPEEEEDVLYFTGGVVSELPAAAPEAASGAVPEPVQENRADQSPAEMARGVESIPQGRSASVEATQGETDRNTSNDLAADTGEPAPYSMDDTPEGAPVEGETEMPAMMTAPVPASTSVTSAKTGGPDLVLSIEEAGNLLDAFTPIEDNGTERIYLLTREEFSGLLEQLPVEFEWEDSKESITLMVTVA